MRRAVVAVAAAFAVLVAEAAFGHAWYRKNRRGEEVHLVERAPTPEEASQGVTAVYGMTVLAGGKAEVFIEDLADCVAKIPLVDLQGDLALVEMKESGDEFVKTQVVKIRGVRAGETTATITVTGDTTKGCTEASKNLLLIRVVEDGNRADQQWGSQWKKRGKVLRGTIREVGQATRAGILDVGVGIRDGVYDAEAGLGQVYALARDSLGANRMLAWNELTSFRTGIVNDLSAGGFAPGDLPKGLAPGAGGSWDTALVGAGLEYSLGVSYLRDTLSKFGAAFDKDSAKAGEGGIAFFATVIDHGLPALQPPVLGSTLPDPAPKLGVDIVGGFALPREMQDPEGYFFAGGYYDPTRGAPEGWVIRTGGAPLPVTITTGAGGTWSGSIEDLAPGYPYAFRLQYAGGADACDTPFTIPNLLRF